MSQRRTDLGSSEAPRPVDGAKVTARRSELGLTRTALAAKANVDRSYISRIESGARPQVSPDVLDAIAEALGVRPQDLVGVDTAAIDVLTTREAATLLRWDISTLRAAIRRQDGTVNAVRLGGRWRVPRSEIERLLTPAPVETRAVS